MKQKQHQAFLVARVKPLGDGPSRYRCLGAYKHNWCYGSAPVKAAHRFVTLTKQKSNAQIVREELRIVEGKYGAFGEEEPVVPRLPCSYTMFLLHMAFNVDYDENSPSLSGCWFAAPLGTFLNVLHASEKVWKKDTMNNEGVTIIDITDPTHPRYCFLPGYDSPSVDLDMTPLTAKAYLDTLSDSDKPTLFLTAEHRREVSALFADVPLVSQRAIAEAWPAGPEDCFKYNEALANEVEDGSAGDCSASSDDLPSVTTSSAAEADQSIVQALATNDDKAIAKIMSQGDRYLNVMHAVRSIGGPFPDDTIPLIAYTLAAAPDTAFDLSDIQLTGEQLLAVLPKDEPLKAVDLSGNATFTLSGLRAVVDAQRKLKLRIHRLVLIRTGVSEEDLIEMMNSDPALFSHIDEVIHPLFYSWRTGPRYPFSWGIAYSRGPHIPKNDTKEASYVALMSLSQVVQSVRLLVDAVVSKKFPIDVRDVALDALTTAGVVPEGKAWGERSVWCTPVPQDAPMAVPRCWQFAIAQLGGFDKPTEYGFILVEPTKPGFVPYVTVGRPKTQKTHFMPVDDFLKRVKDEYPPLSPEDTATLRAACEKLDSFGAHQFKGSYLKPDPEDIPKLAPFKFSLQGDSSAGPTTGSKRGGRNRRIW